MRRTSLRGNLIKHVVRTICGFVAIATASAANPPTITSVFPAGGKAGDSVELKLGGVAIESVIALHSNLPSARIENVGPGRFRVSIPSETMPGFYDFWALGSGGLSAPVSFLVGCRNEIVESATAGAEMTIVPLNSTVNGRISTSGESDSFRFEARKGQRVVLECWAERIDSRLRAVLELFDTDGQRLAANRGHFGRDPLIDWTAPRDGVWTVRLHDLTFGGGDEFPYRLDIDSGPRPLFASPSLVTIDKPGKVAIFGRNMRSSAMGIERVESISRLERIDLDVPSGPSRNGIAVPMRRKVSAAVVDGFAFRGNDWHTPVFIAAGENTAASVGNMHQTPNEARDIGCPEEVEGTLEGTADQSWFALNAKRGESFRIEAFGERIGSPVDLRIGIFDPTGKRELASFSDEPDSPETSLPVGHSDPSGRWVAPADGRYLIAVRNLAGGPDADLRRIYRLSLRREEPDFRVVAAPAGTVPASLNVPGGGRVAFEVVALRRRGFDGPIRVFAENLPSGVECPEVWIGPETVRAMMVLSADSQPVPRFETLTLFGEAHGIGRRQVSAASFVRTASPVAEARLVSNLAYAVTGVAPLRIEADAHRTIQHHLYGTLPALHMPGGVVDVAVRIDRRDPSFAAPVRLSLDGLPPQLTGRTAVLPAGVSEGWISLSLPPTLEPGRYTFVVRAETMVPGQDPAKPVEVVVHSQPVTIDVKPSAFLVEVDPFAARKVKRGETFQIRYASRRRNGFIGKMHTELAVPGIVTDVPGLRGRGETFVGQTDRGSLQIVVNDDAPLGPVQNLRLFTVGVIEDEPVLQGAVFLDLEIVE